MAARCTNLTSLNLTKSATKKTGALGRPTRQEPQRWKDSLATGDKERRKREGKKAPHDRDEAAKTHSARRANKNSHPRASVKTPPVGKHASTSPGIQSTALNDDQTADEAGRGEGRPVRTRTLPCFLTPLPLLSHLATPAPHPGASMPLRP
ncbi:hypothetical protein E2C01_040030 [Portunus trituberculatus]|uniref:Uncharacterized protein n=1 Tax=Portunus trituberculatus TaxID=210409 RepID=A0A5B7FMH5_PORTR|nr:hypothetical protein [Portunus trituberculatus]